MEEKPHAPDPAESEEKRREAEARKRLAKPPKDKKEITIGPTDPTGPDVDLG
jgi:hypothetical protein